MIRALPLARAQKKNTHVSIISRQILNYSGCGENLAKNRVFRRLSSKRAGLESNSVAVIGKQHWILEAFSRAVKTKLCRQALNRASQFSLSRYDKSHFAKPPSQQIECWAEPTKIIQIFFFITSSTQRELEGRDSRSRRLDDIISLSRQTNSQQFFQGFIAQFDSVKQRKWQWKINAGLFVWLSAWGKV